MVGQVFIFLIGALVMGAIALIGWRAISTLEEQQCSAQEATFVKNLQQDLADNLARGKTRTLAYTLPCNADQVCFVSRSAIDTKTFSSTEYPTVRYSVESGEQTNIFLRRESLYEPVPGFTVAAPIGELDNDIVCVEGDTIELRLQGTGQTVVVGTP
jgi:hypothetical protein